VNTNQDKIKNLEILLNELYGDLKETVSQIIERTIQHREYYHSDLKDKLQSSLDNVSSESKKKLK
tara:strand:- start:104 stop:298 length:195 start_codon:yes stop_codon:yes gene_type:complete